MQSIPNNFYYQYHDSEGLSDETNSIGEDLNIQLDDNKIPKKPRQSYLEIIAEAISKSPNQMMQLYEIYNYFQRKYEYFAQNINKSWKNSVRHNLSFNDCFVKAERGINGKGHYWRIHKLAEQDFKQGRLRRRRYLQLYMQSSSMHYSPYGHESVSSYHLPSYHMCSPSLSSYPNTSIETHSITSPISYPVYDPYSTYYHPMSSSYINPNESINFDV